MIGALYMPPKHGVEKEGESTVVCYHAFAAIQKGRISWLDNNVTARWHYIRDYVVTMVHMACLYEGVPVGRTAKHGGWNVRLHLVYEMHS